MTLKGEGKGPLPPMLTQYLELVGRYPDYLVLFQVGDFYECFGEHAEKLARALGLVLTRKSSRDFITPMAGIPVRSADGHIERLLRQGIRVAVADQLENPADGGGLVKREITQLITPGTVMDERLLRPDANYLAAVAAGDGYGLALLDITTGEFRGTRLYSRSSLYDELHRYRPAEVLLAPELGEQEAFRSEFSKRFPVMLSSGRFELEQARSTIAKQFGDPRLDGEPPSLQRAAGAVLSYAGDTQQGALPQVTTFLAYDPGAFMRLDETALRTLEIFENAHGGERTLFNTLDHTRTAPGRRLLRAWLRHPLLDPTLIERRLEAVEALLHDHALRQEVRRILHRLHDLERLATRLALGSAQARDLAALGRSAALIPPLLDRLAKRPEEALTILAARARDLEPLRTLITSALVDEPPLRITEGGLLRDGFDHQLDSLRTAVAAGREWLADLEALERRRTGIPTLKVGFHGVFGYYFEVTRPYYPKVPASYRPLQTLKDRQRYTRNDLRDKEREILRAEEAARKREYRVFDELRKELVIHAQAVRDTGAMLAELDLYAALAEVAARQHYCRPAFTPDRRLLITGGRHPVVEKHHDFIANDSRLSRDERLLILTGPNMSGKSTYLRQTALIILLAQIGSFVPAEGASLPLFDRIFTRIGASDDIAGGRSTFMVEMEELAFILRRATPNSLVLLDEIGRGTSTADGLALAWAAAEYLHDSSEAITLFATHYFELTQLTDRLPGARNLHVAAREEAGGLIFYHQLLPGPSSKAYGLEVAKLAGLPAPVLARARGMLAELTADREGLDREVIDTLLAEDLNRLTPIEALNFLRRLQALARGLLLGEAQR